MIQVTQKCIIAKLRLFHADGAEVCARPTESRLFRPNDEFEDMQAITQSLQVQLRIILILDIFGLKHLVVNNHDIILFSILGVFIEREVLGRYPSSGEGYDS